MYRPSFNLPNDQQSEDRPVLPSISRIFDNGTSRAPSSLTLPPLPDSQYARHRSSETWPQVPLPNIHAYDRAPARTSYHSSSNYASNMQDLPPDPRVSAYQTNQAMTVLASARSLPSRQHSDDAYIRSYGRDREHLPRSSSYTNTHDATGYDPYAASSYSRNYRTTDDVRYHSSSPVYSRTLYDPRVPESSSSSRHQCSYCGKRFSRPSGLKIHITTHTGEKPYVCPEEGCHRSFSVRSNMRRHVRIVHQISPQGTSDSGEDGDSRDSHEEL